MFHRRPFSEIGRGRARGLGPARGAETDRDVCPRGGVGSGVVGPPQAPPEAARRRRRKFFALINGFSAKIAQTCIQHNRLSRRGSARWPLLNVMLLNDALAACLSVRGTFVMLPVRRRTPRCDGSLTNAHGVATMVAKR